MLNLVVHEVTTRLSVIVAVLVKNSPVYYHILGTYTGLLKIIFGVLTTCHTQYT
jgi:hypothetical protein